jgi:hypothetical protein
VRGALVVADRVAVFNGSRLHERFTRWCTDRTAHLRDHAAGRYFHSTTAGETGGEIPVRTSSSLWLGVPEMQTDIFAEINRRIYDNIEVIVRESNLLENPGSYSSSQLMIRAAQHRIPFVA